MSDPTFDSSIEARQHLFKLCNEFRQGMLITEGNAGLRSRPMALKKATIEDGIWFFSDKASPKNREIEKDPHVNVTFMTNDKWVSITGSAQISEDQAKIEELFNEADKLWFPKGPKDSTISLIKVSPVSAEYWDNGGIFKKLQFVAEAAAHYVAGEKFQARASHISEDVKLQL
eukprot:TRINITY_DN87_c0_g1_i1.p1 TRINITY_DN87_c0_g1~~TRINITY_DN87_c0_g1_i1.p1  ORF type:complete len:173 (+),score=36.20 TRINITY_DN87_c0_g1_i1:81-599(+)